MSLRVGIDTGGTFTDFVCLDAAGLRVYKCASTPGSPADAVVAGLEHLAAGARRLDVVHGSTVATNAVLERRGARVALVATEGFADVLRIGRQARAELYNLFLPPPFPLVDPSLSFGLRERIDASGRPLIRPAAAAVDRLARRLARLEVDVVAVCFLHAYANAAHEAYVAGRLRRRGFEVCASHEVLPEYREFERWSTTVVNAYVRPSVDGYLQVVEAGLPRVAGGAGRGRATRAATLAIMQSNGGAISARAARAQPVRTILSGPAAGIVGAQAVARAAGIRRLISFDMGGTSTDVSLLDGAPSVASGTSIGGFPVRLPVLDIHTVGAGGGSIAFVDSGGALRVGPRSAGASPGPACYGRGDDFTVTDANVLLGRLDPERFLGGRMTIDVARARRAAARLAGRLRATVPELAEAVVRAADANMERAIRVVSIERGHDPRAFVLVAFGGAGGMHACALADRLDITRVLVPRYAGVLSALGMLVSDVTRDYSAAVLRRSDETGRAALAARFAPLVSRARRDLSAEGFGRRRQRLDRFVNVRYVGQSSEITVPFSSQYVQAFNRRHEREYGYADPARPTEVVAVRLTASGQTVKPPLPRAAVRRPARARPAVLRPGRFNGRTVDVAFHRWEDLRPGAFGLGPAVITSGEATVVVLPAWRFELDGFGNILLKPATGRSNADARRRRVNVRGPRPAARGESR